MAAQAPASLAGSYLTRNGDPVSQEPIWEANSRWIPRPSVADFVCVLHQCREVKQLAYAKHAHACILNAGLESNRIVGNHVVPMFVECESLADAHLVFNRLCHRNVHSWTSLILGYIEYGQPHYALSLYEQMQEDNVFPSTYTLAGLLRACARLKLIERGRQIHAKITKNQYQFNLFVGTALVDMYAKCGSLAEAHEVLDSLLVRDVVSWTALIGGYAEQGRGWEALKCLRQMQREGVSPNVVTYVCSIKACGSMGAIDKAREIHNEIALRGFGTSNIVSNTLVDMYAKCGLMEEAQNVFNNLAVRDVVSWNALIAGFAENGLCQQALECFKQMQLEGIPADAVTLVCTLNACGNLGATDVGHQVYCGMAKMGFEKDLFVGNALLDMYAKSGSLEEARKVFDKLPAQDTACWTTMIRGYGMVRKGELAIKCFDEMQEQGMKPDAITFTCLLSACSHASLVTEGQEYFRLMTRMYGIAPTEDHYSCMMDLLARSGYLYQAERMFESLPYTPSEDTAKAFLSACKEYGEVNLGLNCFQQLLVINPDDAVPYALMASIYCKCR